MSEKSAQILAVVGSLGARSRNRALLEIAARVAPPDVVVTLFDAIGSLPHFDPDLGDRPQPSSVGVWRSALAASDAVLIAAPEYGLSLPGVLKNAIDWVIGTGELEAKIVAITASVAHPERGKKGLAALAEPLSALNVKLVHDAPIVRGDGAEAALVALLAALAKAVRSGR